MRLLLDQSLFLILSLAWVTDSDAFAPHPLFSKSQLSATPRSRLNLFFADEASKKTTTPAPWEAPMKDPVAATVDLVASDEEGFLNKVGSILVDSFWLGSEHHQLKTTEMTSAARTNLLIEQCADLQDKYGARMGKRLLNSCVIGALDPETKQLLGVVTVKVTLMEKEKMIDPELAEDMLKQAVASLRPTQRRQYKDAPAYTIARELLSPDTKAICILCNLAVSPTARRRGIAKTLANEVEVLVKDWGYDELYLLVESANKSARNLYEDKLGYQYAFTKEGAPAMRADLETGKFIETQADTRILRKGL